MMMGLAWTAIVALFAATSMWPAAASPLRPEIAVPDAVMETDGRRHRHHGHRHHHDGYSHRYRPGWGYWPHPGHYQPPYYYPRYYYPPPRSYYPPRYYEPNPGFYFYYRN